MARPTKHEQFEKLMKMPVEEHARRAGAFTAKAAAAAAQAEKAELEAQQHHEAAEILADDNFTTQAQQERERANAKEGHADILRRQEQLHETHAQNHTLAMGRIAAEKARIHTAAVRHANAHRRANPTGTRTHNELVDFHTARLSEAAGLAPHSVQHQGKTITITHKPVAGFIPAHSWLAKTIRKTRTGHAHGTKGGRRKTRRRRRRSKRRRTRKRRTKRRRTRRRHKHRRRHRRRR